MPLIENDQTLHVREIATRAEVTAQFATVVEAYNENFRVLAGLIGDEIAGLNDLGEVVNANSDVLDALHDVVDRGLAATEALAELVLDIAQTQAAQEAEIRFLMERDLNV